MTQETQMTTLRLPVETKRQLDKIATFYDRKPHWLILKAVENLVAHENAQMALLQQLDQEAEQAKKAGQLVDAADACDAIDALIATARAKQVVS